MSKINVELPRLAYSVAESAQMLNLSEKTILRLIQRNLLKASKALRHKRITARSLREFLATTSGEVVGNE
jgi:excisionase family DNA binding protein